jgi:hypothetical protein
LRDLHESELSTEVEFLAKALDIGETKDRKVFVTDFYPELTLKEPYTGFLIGSARGSAWIQLPFFEQVILPVRPYKNQKAFRVAYGMTVNEFVELVKLGKIVPLRQNRLLEYANLDYLDPILEMKPPSFARTACFDVAVYGGVKLLETLDAPPDSTAFRRVCRAYSPMIDHDVRACGPKSSSGALGAANDYWGLALAGYQNLADRIIALRDPKIAAVMLAMFGEMLCDAPRDALNGIVSIDRESILADLWNVGCNLTALRFPSDIGKLLIRELKLINISAVGFDGVISICKDTGRARKALLEFDKSVAKIESEMLIDRAHALEVAWHEANQANESIIRRKRRVQPMISASIGISGALAGSLGGLPGLLSGGLCGVLSSIPLAEPVADKIARFGKPNNVVALYDLKSHSAS